MGPDLTKDKSNVDRIVKLARLTGTAQHYVSPEPSEGLEPLPTTVTTNETVTEPKVLSRFSSFRSGLEPLPTTVTTDDTLQKPTRKLETVTEPMVLPKFSLSSLEGVRKLGMTQMEHYVGKNLED